MLYLNIIINNNKMNRKLSKEELEVLKNIFKEIVDNDVEILKDIESDVFGFDRWSDWVLKLNKIVNDFSFCREIEVWNGIVSDFNGEYRGNNFREVEEDYLNIIKNKVSDEEFLKYILEYWEGYFSEYKNN